MTLANLEVQKSYRSGREDLLESFYLPCLQEADQYDRAVGYFSSSLFVVSALAFSDFVLRGGRARIVCSPNLTPQDVDAIRAGHARDAVLDARLRTEILALANSSSSNAGTRLLATLIAGRVLELKIAYRPGEPGIFHDKLGIFKDSSRQRISFRGSGNETFSGWTLNHESFDAFASWKSEEDLLRIRDHEDYFRDLWHNDEAGVVVVALPEVPQAELEKFADKHGVEAAVHEFRRAAQHRRRGPGLKKELLPHQTAVLENWQAQGHRGIVAFATGAGKTLTAIEAMRRWCEPGRPALVLVPGRELHRQWQRELAQEYPQADLLLARRFHRAAR